MFGEEILFEPDEERSYRVLPDYEKRDHANREIDIEILKAVAEAIETLVKEFIECIKVSCSYYVFKYSNSSLNSRAQVRS